MEEAKVRRIKVERARVAIVCVYRRRGEKIGLKIIREWMEERNKELALLGGDLNAWTGEKVLENGK